MSTTKKVLIIITSQILLAAFIGAVVWGVINWSKLKEGMKGSGLYTQEDIQKSYEDGFNNALSDKEEYEKLINSYKDTITNQNDLIAKHTSEVNALNNSIKEYQDEILLLTEQKNGLETQITTLQAIKQSNQKTIEELNSQIDGLNAEIALLENNSSENVLQIENLKSQIVTLQSLNEQLQNTNTLNTTTINSLNAQNTVLSERITELTNQLENNSSTVTALNNKIAELQKSVQYYEQYISSLEQGEQVIATFEFNGSVYNIQVTSKNAVLTVTPPESTEFVIFNGWTVDGEAIDLASFQITQNTRFIADVTYKYSVKFKVDDLIVNENVVLKNSNIAPPAEPVKTGYAFVGWTTNGTKIVDFDDYKVTSHIVFTAKFVKLHTVTFEYEGVLLDSKLVRAGNFATPPETENTIYKVFNGWKVGGVLVDIANYKINSNTTFVADITYKYDVKFMADSAVHNSQVVVKNGKATLPAEPKKDGYSFEGWTLDGNTIIDVSRYTITQNIQFIAKFEKLYVVNFEYEDISLSTQNIKAGNYASVPNAPSTEYKVLNGWKVNGNIVDITTYKITSDTTFVADITYKYDVKFMVDNSIYQSKIVTKGEKAALPTQPNKNGYKFICWSLDGTNSVDIEAYTITENTTFTAVFKQIFTVQFMVDNQVYNSQNILEGATAETVAPPAKNGYVFQGWTLDGVNIVENVNTAPISSNIKYIAKFELLRVKLVDGDTFNDGYYSRRDYITAVTFDKYSNANYEYIVNGTNILDRISGIDVASSDNKYGVIKMYNVKDHLYVLSDGIIVLNENCRGLFACLRAVQNFYFHNIDTSEVTDMFNMFYECKTITNLDLTCFNTSKVTNMGYMFASCMNLVNVNLSSFNTGNVISMGWMFEKCSKLASLDVSNFDTRKVTNMSSMFSQCSSATRIYVGSNFSTTIVQSSSNMFYDCVKLPNFTSSQLDKTRAHTGSGGYLTLKG